MKISVQVRSMVGDIGMYIRKFFSLALVSFSMLASSALLATDLVWDQGNWDDNNWYSSEAPPTDSDADGVVDSSDNCPQVSNSSQINTDGDTQGDACDTDDDNDGVLDVADNCPLNSNTSQIDTDGDHQGNVCDANDDNDSVLDVADAFPLDPTEWNDTDSDGTGDNADTDADNDGVSDITDNCLVISNANQLDSNSNGVGDACEATDSDNDGVNNNVDNCPDDSNTNQADLDGDNIGDKCDEPAPLPDDNIGEVKKDARGKVVAFAGDFNGDGYGDYVVGIPGYDVKNEAGKIIKKDAGRAEVISGKDGEVLASVDGELAKDSMGAAVAGGARVNNDAYDDVVVGAPKADDVASKHVDAGSVTVLYGRSDVDLNPAQNEGFYGAAVKILSGSAVALGDVNNDSRADIIIGAPKADDVTNKHIDAGSVTIIDGNTLVVLPDIYYGSTTKAYAGTSVAAGNVDAVAGADIIIGAPNDDDLANKLKDTGSVTVYNIADATTPVIPKQYGAVAKAFLGKSVAAGNIDGVVGDEVLAGAPGDDTPATPNAKKIADTGSVTVFFADVAVLPVKKYGASPKASLGNSVAAGDVNGDGKAEIIAGASKDDKPGVPKAIFDIGSVSVWNGDGYEQIGDTLYGGVAKDYFGTAVSAGDINSDGKADLIIGMPGFDVDKLTKESGKVILQSGESL